MLKRLIFIFGLIALGAFNSLAQISVAPMPVPRYQFFDAAGKPLAFGWVCTFAAGGVIPLASYTDYTGTVANATCPTVATPASGIHLDSGGYADIWLGPSAYNIFVLNSGRVTQWSVDGVNSPTGNITLAGLTVNGNIVVTGTASFGCVPRFNNIRWANCFSGATAGAKIAAAVADLDHTYGGTVDARGIWGAQVVSQDMLVGVTWPGKLVLGEALFSTSVTQTVPSNWTVEGIGGGRDLAGSGAGKGTVLKWTGAINLPMVSILNQQDVTLRNLTLWANDTVGSIGILFDSTAGNSNNFLTIEHVNIYDFKDTAIVWGTGGAAGADGSQVVIDGGKIEGSNGDALDEDFVLTATTKGIVINSAAAGFGSIRGQLHIRTVNKGIHFLYSGGQVEVNDVIFGDPVGGAPAGGISATTPNSIEFTRIDRTVILNKVYMESGLNAHVHVAGVDTFYNDVRWRSVYGGAATYLYGLIRIEGSGLNFPSVFDGPVSISSDSNTWNYGPASVTNAFGSVFTTNDKVAYGAGSFTVWANGVAKAKGAVIIPTVPNGHYYRASDAGTTAAGEPAWPVGDGDTIVDNPGVNQITWTEVGVYVVGNLGWTGATYSDVVSFGRGGRRQMATLYDSYGTTNNYRRLEMGTDAVGTGVGTRAIMAVTVQDAANTVTLPLNPFPNGTLLQFDATGNGITLGTDYWVCNSTATTFTLDTAGAGCAAPLAITSDGTNTISASYSWRSLDLWGSGIYFYPLANHSTSAWRFTSVGDFLPSTTVTYNIGSDSYRPKNAYVRRLLPSLYVLAPSATPIFDSSLGDTIRMILTANVTSSTITNALTGHKLTLLLCQDAGGAKTMAWPAANFKLVGATFVLTVTASKCDSVTLVNDGTDWYEIARSTNL